jgi:hypothetical protein
VKLGRFFFRLDSIVQAAMASSEEHIASDFQAFRSHDGEPLDNHFKGAIHLEDQHQRNIMFMVDNNGEM